MIDTNSLIALPTWLLVRAAWPWLPKEHPFKPYKPYKPFTLQQWHKGATPYCRRFDWALWILSTMIAAMLTA